MKTKKYSVSSNQDLVIKLLKKHKWVNPSSDGCIDELVIEKVKNILPGQLSALTFYIGWLKRLHSHLRNITTSVVNPFN
jgi:hypothetical protein